MRDYIGEHMPSATSLKQVLKKLDAVEQEIQEMKHLLLPTVRLSPKEMAEIRKAEREISRGEYVKPDELKKMVHFGSFHPPNTASGLK